MRRFMYYVDILRQFSLLYLNMDKALKNSTPGKVAYIWRIERFQIDAIKFEMTQIHFYWFFMFSVFVFVVVVVGWGRYCLSVSYRNSLKDRYFPDWQRTVFRYYNHCYEFVSSFITKFFNIFALDPKKETMILSMSNIFIPLLKEQYQSVSIVLSYREVILLEILMYGKTVSNRD